MLMVVHLILQYFWTCEEQGEEYPSAWEKFCTFSEPFCYAHTFAAWLVPQTRDKHRLWHNNFPLAYVKSQERVALCQPKLSPREVAGFQRVAVRQQ